MPSTPASTDPRLIVEGLTVAYGRGGPPAVDNVDLRAEAGQVVAIVGESGAGKSSIGSALLDLVDPPGSWRATRMLLDGEPIDYQVRHKRGRDVSVIFQDPQTALNPLFTVAEQLIQMLGVHENLFGRAAFDRAVQMLDAVGIEDARARASQYPHQFSGGMRQRVVIALALACNPRLVIADEPTSALDVSVRGQILDLIRNLSRDRGTAVLLITHDMASVARIADRVAVMRTGQIVETATAGDLLEHPQHAYSRMLIAAVPPGDRTVGRFAIPTEDNIAAAPNIRGLDVDHWLRARGSDHAGETVLSVEDVTKNFSLTPGLFGRGRKRLVAVNSVSFQIRRGEAFGLVGESGSGKSTIAHIVAGLRAPTAGKVVFGANALVRATREAKIRAYRQGMQMVFQDPFSSLNRRMRVGDTVAEPIRAANAAERTQTRHIVAALFERVGLPPDSIDRHPHAFSGGQRQRIALARALAGRPRLLICDEPTSALDVSIQAALLNLLMDLKDDLGLSMLFISHDLPVVRQIAQRIGVLSRGHLVETGWTDAVFDRPADPYTIRLMDELPHRRQTIQGAIP